MTGPAIMAQLSVRRGREAVEFYRAAFGAQVVYRVGGTTDEEGVVAQLAVGDAQFWVSDEAPAVGNPGPETLGGSSVRLLLVVDDPATVIERAVSAGATLDYPAAEEHGWLLGRVTDPYGHSWEIGTPRVPWPPASGTPHGHG